MKTEQYIRGAELFIALISTFLVGYTMLNTSIYFNIRPYAQQMFGPFLILLGLPAALIDFVILGIAMTLSFLLWRAGTDVSFGRIFTLNMLLYFPSVIDFSTFNWIKVIIPYTETSDLTPLWVFGVGISLQVTYLFLRYTVRFRYGRDELINRGAEMEDVDKVSWGQMYYLSALVGGTAMICFVLFYLQEISTTFLDITSMIPSPHVIIGITISLLIAGATVVYLRDSSKKAN